MRIRTQRSLCQDSVGPDRNWGGGEPMRGSGFAYLRISWIYTPTITLKQMTILSQFLELNVINESLDLITEVGT